MFYLLTYLLTSLPDSFRSGVLREANLLSVSDKQNVIGD